MGIICKNIKKYYGKQLVIENFNYYFGNKGLYVLYGESGSGKTTLLNIIYGIEFPSSGSIEIDSTNYNLNNNELIKDKTAYISQNNYLIDYLTILDNLKLSLSDKQANEINKWLKAFNLIDKKYNYPNELSGGEKERIAIITAILQKKQILLLDEPTSSLDKKNKENLLSILSNLKEKCLIICATHDKELIKIADYQIDVENITKYKSDEKNNDFKPLQIKNEKSKILKYTLKQFHYKNSEKISTLILIIIFAIVILIFNMCCKSNEKIEQSLLTYYNINFVNYYCDINNQNRCDNAVKKYNGTNIFLYENVPSGECYDDGYCETVEYNLTAETLPLNKELFSNIDNYLLYGSYFNNANEVILGYDLAKSISTDLESLIGTEYKITFPDKDENLLIVGILKDIDDEPYFNTLSGITNQGYKVYITDEYASKYQNMFEKYHYQDYIAKRAYFNNLDDLKNFYQSNLKCVNEENICKSSNGIVIKKYENNFIKFSFLITDLEYYLIPGTIISFIVAIIFYYQVEKNKNRYQGHILAVYKSYGYKWSTIIFNNILANVINITKIFSISFCLSLVLSPLFNYTLRKLSIVKFNLFLINFEATFILFLTLIISTIIFSFYNCIILKRNSWLISLRNGEDFL